MTLFRTIVFPVDFSDATAAMVSYVTEMARRFDATVIVLNAFDLVPTYVLAPSLEGTHGSERTKIPYTPVLQELRTQREQQLEEFSATHFSSVKQKTMLEDGDPAMVIDSVVQRENADLIVIATKGLGAFRRLLLGSTAAKVLHDVRCPVLTSAHEPDPARPSPCGYQSILCAVELNPEADVVIDAAVRLAHAYRAKMCLLHIEPVFHLHDERLSAEAIRCAFEHALNTAEHEFDVDITVRVLDAGVPEGVRRAAMEEKADLVVVGRGHQQGNFSRMWSRLNTIIREAPCPVLSV